jgi:hypothetical protein
MARVKSTPSKGPTNSKKAAKAAAASGARPAPPGPLPGGFQISRIVFDWDSTIIGAKEETTFSSRNASFNGDPTISEVNRSLDPKAALCEARMTPRDPPHRTGKGGRTNI